MVALVIGRRIEMKIYQALTLTFLFIVLTAMVLNPASQFGQLKDVTKLKIVDYGIYEKQELMRPKDKTTVAGEVSVVKNEVLVIQTDTIPLKVGQTFGLRYEIVTSEKGEKFYPVTYHVSYPREMVNPETGKREKDWTFKTRSIGNSPRYTGFGFDEEWELLEGDWIFEITVGKHVVRQKFHLIKS